MAPSLCGCRSGDENLMVAFMCSQCPRSADVEKGGCPAWWEVLERHSATDAERLTSDCAFRVMPRFLTETMRMAHRAAAQSAADREAVGEAIRGALSISRGVAVAAALAGGRSKPWKALPGADDVVGQSEHYGAEDSLVYQQQPSPSRYDGWEANAGPASSVAGGGGRVVDARSDPAQADLVEWLRLDRRHRGPSVG